MEPIIDPAVHAFQQLVHHLLQCQPLVDACTNQYLLAGIAYAALAPTDEERCNLTWVMRAGDMRLVRAASTADTQHQKDSVFWLHTACANGHLSVARWLHITFHLTPDDARSDDNSALRWECKNGHLSVAQWLHTTFQLTPDDVRAKNNYALEYSCANGHLAVAQWLCTTFQLTAVDARSDDSYALQCSCANGYLAVAQWLHATFQLTDVNARSYNNYALRWACEHGHLSVAQWLHSTFRLTTDDARIDNNYALRGACKNGHLAVAQWLRATFEMTLDDMLALVNSPQSVRIDADAHARIMRYQPWSRVCDCVATRLLSCAGRNEQEEEGTKTLFLEQVVLSLSDAFVQERLYYVRHLNGDVWDFRRDNLRLEAMQPSAFAGVVPTLHTHTWLVMLPGCKSRPAAAAAATERKKCAKPQLLPPLVAVCATELEAAFVYNLARHATCRSKKHLALNVVSRPLMSDEHQVDLRRQLSCWIEAHAHTTQPTRCVIPRNAQGIAILSVRQGNEDDDNNDTQETQLLVDDDVYLRVSECVVDWQRVCGTLFHPHMSLAAMIFNPAAPHLPGTAFVHCNGDTRDFRHANLKLLASFQPASATMRHAWLLDRQNHYVRISEDGQHVAAAKGEHLTHASGPYPPHVIEWAACQVARDLYGASPPVIGGCARFGVEHPPQPVGWIWHAGRGLFIGRHHDVAEHAPPRPHTILGVRPTADGSHRFCAWYGQHELGTYDTPWLAAWTHDTAVLSDTAYLALSPPVAINGVPRPVGHVYCPHAQRTVLDTRWLKGRIGVAHA